MKTTEDKIADLIDSYKSLPNDSVDLETMVNIRKDLSIELFQCSRDLGIARKEWKAADRRFELRKNQIRVMESSKGTSKADWISRANTQKELDELGMFEAIYYALDYIIKATKEVLNEMNQRISLVKDEFVRSNYFQAQ